MISIIIPCKNRIEKLELCLKSIYEALDFASLTENSEFEIIVINDHSDIGFRDKVLNLFPYIKIIDSDGIGPGYARNLGIKNSNGNYLFFTDSDCVVSKDWIMEGIKMFNKTNSLVIQGVPWLFQKNTNVYMGNQEEKLYKTMFSTYLYNGNKTKMTDSRNLLMKADIVKILGDEVFSKSMTKAAAESRVFGSRCLNKNIEILFDINLKIYHEDSNNIEEVCKQKYRHGSGRIEIWKDYKDYEGLYQASNLGRMRSLDRWVKGPNSSIRFCKGRILKPCTTKDGYLLVNLCKNGKVKSFLVHRLVAEAFIDNTDNLPQVNHKDENKLNNNVDNLEWCDAQYNSNYGTRTERLSKSKINGKCSKIVLQYDLNGNFIKE